MEPTLCTLYAHRIARILLGEEVPLSRSASTAAADLIREAILDGRLDPGQRLKEEELAGELGISRTPVREALLFLQVEGLVESVPNRGATVRSYSPDEIQDLYGLRALLEGHAARCAASRTSSEEASRLHESNERFAKLRAVDDVRDLIKENFVFHSIVLDAAGSERLASLVRNVIVLPLVYKSYAWYSGEQKLISEHYHRRLTHALEAGDAERAELIMKEHVFEARDSLVARLKERHDGTGSHRN